MESLVKIPKTKLRRARLFYGFSQKQLASKLGVSPQTIWLWEHGKLIGALPNNAALALAFIQQWEIDAAEDAEAGKK